MLGTAISLTFIESMNNKLFFKIMYIGCTSSKWSNRLAVVSHTQYARHTQVTCSAQPGTSIVVVN